MGLPCVVFLAEKGLVPVDLQSLPSRRGPFDRFPSSLPAEGHKLSLEKPTDVGG